MKSGLSIFLFLLIISQACKTPSKTVNSANELPSPPDSVKITVVSFNSICCGVRSDDFLKTFYESFKRDNNAKLYARKATGCGKEGEYKVWFATGDLTAGLQQKFSTALKSLIENETRTNTGSQQGTVNIEITDSVNVSYCRGGEKVF